MPDQSLAAFFRFIAPRLRHLGFFLWVSAAAAGSYGQAPGSWLPLKGQDLQTKAPADDPAAAAIQLYYSDFRDDEVRDEWIYHRIKVLTAQAKTFTEVELSVPAACSVSDLEARTIRPDMSIVASGGHPALRENQLRLPEVAAGSLIDYKYRLQCDSNADAAVWTLQHDLYTVKEDFQLRLKKGVDGLRVSYVFSNLPTGLTPKENDGTVTLEMENVPAFKAEPFMPPEANFKPEVRFFYRGAGIDSPEAFWHKAAKEWHSQSELFIGEHSEIKAAASEIAGGEPDPEKKLRKLYARVQQMAGLKDEDRRGEAGAANQNVVVLLKHGRGTHNEIAELFTALARASGFEADLLRVSSRQRRVFDSKLLTENQLETELVRVRLSASDLYLDPGTKLCPFGLVPWMYTSVPALQLNTGEFVLIPTASADKSVLRRVGKLELQPGGALHGEVTLQFKGNAALERRLIWGNMEDSARQKMLEEELKGWLPEGARVRLKELQDSTSSEDPMIARFEVDLPGPAALGGRNMSIPANIFRSRITKALDVEKRKYPVYFPYTYEELDSVTIQLPQGYAAHNVPQGQDEKLAATRFLTTRSSQGSQLVETRALVVNSIYFQLEKFHELSQFFHKLGVADGEQVMVAVAQ